MGKRNSHNLDHADSSTSQPIPKKTKKKGQSISAQEADEQPIISISKLVFFKRHLQLTVSLLPGAVVNVTKSIEDALRTLLFRYSDGLEGILLAFTQLEFLDQGKGRIFNELPHIHYQIRAQALVFSPSAGCQLSGQVTESFHSHVSMTVFHYFNASVAAEHLRAAGFAFDDVLEQWHLKKDKGESKVVAKGDCLEFLCQTLHESGGIISLTGTNPRLRSK